MPTAAFTTLGCKVNQYETQRILDDFEERGFAITEFNQPADIYVINTCSVTQAAERKSRAMVRRAARQNPGAKVVMTGCYGEMSRIKGECVEEAHLLVPNPEKLRTLQHVLKAFPELTATINAEAAPVRSYHRRTRATLKVQDGCNVFCAFCSIPYTRALMHSRPPEELLAEVEKRVQQGYREIVVTGVLVGAYGEDAFQPVPGKLLPRRTGQELSLASQTLNSGSEKASTSQAGCADLAAILRRIAQVPGIERVRLSSIEPTQVTDRLLDAFAEEPKLCPHLHIPLQSGDTGVLTRMNRPYDRAFYLERCKEAYRRIPNLAITSDIMVGFPGEDEAAFEQTIEMVRQVGYARAHIFRYSSRPGTPAAEFEDQVLETVKEERAHRLAEVCRESQKNYILRHVGARLNVLVEGKGNTAEAVESETVSGADSSNANGGDSAGQLLSGYTDNYIRVQFTGGSHLIGKVVPVRLLEPSGDGALGEAGGAYFGPNEAPPDAVFLPLAAFTGETQLIKK